ncbi:STE/STE20 protein kinase [Corchorus capsularis]|uniref:STE/STE20 protein kinase n=1 Tax=Corchorus capsularis TaxID=210143 RepID=A0A1R3II37_COCAP|nr:STE/STE20 protein kinase [Corchorus capsularis]
MGKKKRIAAQKDKVAGASTSAAAGGSYSHPSSRTSYPVPGLLEEADLVNQVNQVIRKNKIQKEGIWV